VTSRRQVAERFGISEATLRTAEENGSLPPFTPDSADQYTASVRVWRAVRQGGASTQSYRQRLELAREEGRKMQTNGILLALSRLIDEADHSEEVKDLTADEEISRRARRRAKLLSESFEVAVGEIAREDPALYARYRAEQDDPRSKDAARKRKLLSERYLGI